MATVSYTEYMKNINKSERKGPHNTKENEDLALHTHKKMDHIINN
jgi:hypothetical protein